MQERGRNFKAFAGSQLTRLASSNAVNRAYELGVRVKDAAVQASQSSVPTSGGQPQSWKEWALQKIPTRGPTNPGVETVYLFPGWATRKSTNKDAGFTLCVHISGFASSLRPPESATRSQKAFMALARRMAALPPLPINQQPTVIPPSQIPLSPSMQDLLRSEKAPEELEAEELQALNAELDEMPPELRPTLSRESAASSNVNVSSIPLEQLRRMHDNLDRRLQPFWSSSIPNRQVILSIFASTEEEKGDSIETTSFTPLEDDRQPLFKIQTSTDAQGTFSQVISIPYETICTNPYSLGIAFGGYEAEPRLIVQAELKPPPMPAPSSQQDEGYFTPPKMITTHIAIPISNQQIRVISDIDDTIKIADVLSGVKKIFHNVFVTALEDLIVPGMNKFYQKLYARGVRFHYVSNSPYGLLPIITEFLQVAELPQGSLRLRFYGGRSLFGGLWEPAGERKRGGVEHVLNSFHDSKFFLIGDTGEQDLELYCDLARERPDQIIGIFLRDVVPVVDLLGAPMTEEPASIDPQPLPAWTSNPSTSTTPRSSSLQQQRQNSLPYTPRSRSGTDPRRPQLQASPSFQQQPRQQPPMQLPPSFIDDEPLIPGRDVYSQANQDQMKMSPTERRRFDLDQRIARARQSIPRHIVLRVFRNAEENEEDAFAIIDSLMSRR